MSTRRRHPFRADLLAIGAFLCLLALVLGNRFRDDSWLAQYDIMTYFLPWYGELGDRLRAGDIPGWMPWLASGSPFAGDPSGGWWYLPAMVAFHLFDVLTAFKTMVVVQTIIGGVATYAFSRCIGLRPVASLFATTGFVFGPFLAAEMMYGTVAGQASTWIAVALVGVDASLRARGFGARLAWWGLVGLAISQLAVAWPGQGLYNGLLLIAGWIGYRALLWPVEPDRPWRRRWWDLFLTGPAVLLLGFLLGAAGILPRLSVNRASNIPDGDYAGIMGGNYLVTPYTLASLLRDLLRDDPFQRPVSLAAPIVIFALIAILLGRGRFGIPFFTAVIAVVALLSMNAWPLRPLFDLLPGFAAIHGHSPRRIWWTCYLLPCLLAGAGLESLLRWRLPLRTLPLLGVPLLLVVGAAGEIRTERVSIGLWPILLAAAATAFAGILAIGRMGVVRFRSSAVPTAISVVLIAITLMYPIGRDALASKEPMIVRIDNDGACRDAPLDTYLSRTDPGGAGAFLQQQQATGQPFRYVAYAGRNPAQNQPSYSRRRCEPAVLSVLYGGRAMRLGLETAQGYNPLHLGAYVDYIDAMNGGPQNYHWVDPYPSALINSQLLDMLNVRYIVVSTAPPEARATAMLIASRKREVFRDGRVVVYENPDAFPRAWVVHDVRGQATSTTLRQLASREVDGRQVAFVNGALPHVEPLPDAGATETVTVTEQGDDSMTATVTAASAGLVVFSEIYAPGWSAWVDGTRTDMLKTDGALRGIPVEAGRHTIEMRYELPALRIGLWISGISAMAMISVSTVAIRQWWIARRDIAAGSA